LHDALLAFCSDDFTTEGILVVREAGVLAAFSCIALGWALRGRLAGAPCFALCWVRIIALWAMVVAVWQREIRARVISALILASNDSSLLGDLQPRLLDEPTTTTIIRSAETYVLRGQRELDGGLCRNAHPV